MPGTGMHAAAAGAIATRYGAPSGARTTRRSVSLDGAVRGLGVQSKPQQVSPASPSALRTVKPKSPKRTCAVRDPAASSTLADRVSQLGSRLIVEPVLSRGWVSEVAPPGAGPPRGSTRRGRHRGG